MPARCTAHNRLAAIKTDGKPGIIAQCPAHIATWLNNRDFILCGFFQLKKKYSGVLGVVSDSHLRLLSDTSSVRACV